MEKNKCELKFTSLISTVDSKKRRCRSKNGAWVKRNEWNMENYVVLFAGSRDGVRIQHKSILFNIFWCKKAYLRLAISNYVRSCKRQLNGNFDQLLFKVESHNLSHGN